MAINGQIEPAVHRSMPITMSVGQTGPIELVNARDLCPVLPSKPKVLVIVTGGTICMTHEGVSASLRPASLADRLRELTNLDDPTLPSCDILEWEQLLDSSDVSLSHWVHIATDIEENYCLYDGFVVLHGTDTLAYTASALSFMLENLNKPVVLTGAMLPMHHIQTDARKNYYVALMIAAYSQLTEVCVLFGSRLLRGNRCTKVDCSRMDAFKSPNFPLLGQIGVDIRVDEQLALMPSKRGFRVFPHFCMNIVVVTVTPAFQPELLRSLFSSPTRPLAVILKLYGSGTAPTRNSDLLTTLKEGLESGVEIMSVSQCVAGTCSLLTYESGAMFYHIGVIEGKDITVEAAFAKLAYLLGKGYAGEKLRYFMETDIRGEVTERPAKVTGQASLAALMSQPNSSFRTLIPYTPPNELRTTPQLSSRALDVAVCSVTPSTEACSPSNLKTATMNNSTPGRPASFHWNSGFGQDRAAQIATRRRVSSLDGHQPTSPHIHHEAEPESIGRITLPRVRSQAKTLDDVSGFTEDRSLRVHIEHQPLIVSKKDEALERGPRTPVVPKEIDHVAF